MMGVIGRADEDERYGSFGAIEPCSGLFGGKPEMQMQIARKESIGTLVSSHLRDSDRGNLFLGDPCLQGQTPCQTAHATFQVHMDARALSRSARLANVVVAS